MEETKKHKEEVNKHKGKDEAVHTFGIGNDLMNFSVASNKFNIAKREFKLLLKDKTIQNYFTTKNKDMPSYIG